MEPFIGQIMIFGGDFAPKGWAFCDGQLLPIASNTSLYSILGTRYGGDGVTTFALPDMRGRVSIGPRHGPGLSPYVEGQKGGVESVTLNTAEMPQHTHSLHAESAVGDQQSPAGHMLAFTANPTYATVQPATDQTMAQQSIGMAGGTLPHTNMQPYIAVNFIIALYGIYPSRN